jgi:hypothetical protein
MKLTETETSLIENAMIAAIQRWEDMIAAAKPPVNPQVAGVIYILDLQVKDTRAVLHKLQDAEEVVIA